MASLPSSCHVGRHFTMTAFACAPQCGTRTAKLRQSATVEEVDLRIPRSLDRALFLRLSSCDWVREHRHCLITGACGTGKSFIACALGDKACRDNLSVLYQRSSRLFGALALPSVAIPIADTAGTLSNSDRGDGRYARLMRQLARVSLLIIDDFGPEPLNAEQRRDLLEIVDDRYNSGSLIITSQVPVDRWYESRTKINAEPRPERRSLTR